MSTQFHLIRHGHHALLGRILCGRMPGVQLDAIGCRQMARCADVLADSASLVIQSSPQRRAQQSASIIASSFRLPVEVVPALDEIDLGDWTGRSFDDLRADSRWLDWNERRGTSCPPNGESMKSLQHRMVRHLEQVRTELPTATVAIVSHAEPIRAVILHYLGIPLDEFMSIDVDPSSISTLLMDDNCVYILRVNQKVPA